MAPLSIYHSLFPSEIFQVESSARQLTRRRHYVHSVPLNPLKNAKCSAVQCGGKQLHRLEPLLLFRFVVSELTRLSVSFVGIRSAIRTEMEVGTIANSYSFQKNGWNTFSLPSLFEAYDEVTGHSNDWCASPFRTDSTNIICRYMPPCICMYTLQATRKSLPFSWLWWEGLKNSDIHRTTRGSIHTYDHTRTVRS